MSRWAAIIRHFPQRCRQACRGLWDFLARREGGASLVEYALLIGLLALATVAALQFMSNSFSNAFNYIGNTISNHSQPN